MSGTISFLTIRVMHVLLAALWLGAAAFVSFFLIPAIQQVGPGAEPLLGALGQRRIEVFMASIGGITVLTGIALYWRLTGHFDPALSGTRTAMVYGTGGIAGIIALVIGASVVGRNAKRMVELSGKAASLPEGPERNSAFAQITPIRRRIATFGLVVVVLQIIALTTMVIGHYV